MFWNLGLSNGISCILRALLNKIYRFEIPFWNLGLWNGISCIFRALSSKIYRFEISFLTVYLVKKCFRTFQGEGAWPHGTPQKYATGPMNHIIISPPPGVILAQFDQYGVNKKLLACGMFLSQTRSTVSSHHCWCLPRLPNRRSGEWACTRQRQPNGDHHVHIFPWRNTNAYVENGYLAFDRFEFDRGTRCSRR